MTIIFKNVEVAWNPLPHLLNVGYENPSSFSREYKMLFGAPPQRDIARLLSNLER